MRPARISTELQSSVLKTVSASEVRIGMMMETWIVSKMLDCNSVLHHHFNPDNGGKDILRNTGL
jgi:hypothetical protein